MSREYPDWLDPWKAAEGRRTFAGSMPLKRMPRLAPLLAGNEGEAQFSAAFSFDQQQRVTIHLDVAADLPLVCQTSLDTYLEPVRRASLLGVMEDLAEEAMMPENYEPVVAVNGRLALQDLVEDELLLGMPQVPRKPEVDGDSGEAGGRFEAAGQETAGGEYIGGENTIGELAGGEISDQVRGGSRATEKEAVRQPFAGLAEQLRKFAAEKKQGR